MKFSLITAILTGASVVVAMPTSPLKRQTDVCPGTDSNAQCCATDVLGVADLNCFNRKFFRCRSIGATRIITYNRLLLPLPNNLDWTIVILTQSFYSSIHSDVCR